MGNSYEKNRLHSILFLLLLLLCSVSDVFCADSDNHTRKDNVMEFLISFTAMVASLCIFVTSVRYAQNCYRQMNKGKEYYSARIREYAEHIGRQYNVTVHQAWDGEHIYNHLTREELAALRENATQSRGTAGRDETYDVLGARNASKPADNFEYETVALACQEPQENGSSTEPAVSGTGESRSKRLVVQSYIDITPNKLHNPSSQYTMVDMSAKRNKDTSHSALDISGSNVQLCLDTVDVDGNELSQPPTIPDKLYGAEVEET